MNLPHSMTYIAVQAPGGPEVLTPTTGPVPEAGANEVLIRVMAAGVNRPDVQQRKGAYPPPPGASSILGLEVAGEIAAVGPGVTGFAIDERVCALTNGGGYAQYCVAPAAQCLPWPRGYGAVHAAALPETYFTVWANLFRIGGLNAGESALVHGGSSGIGLTAIQLAHEFGARVYATAGSREKCDACVRFGADAALNYHETDFVQGIRKLTSGRGVDIVLDMVGGSYLGRNLKCLAMDGRLVVIAFLGGSIVDEFDLTPVVTRRLKITGSTMRPRTEAQKAALADDLHTNVWPVLDVGRCRPVIDTEFPLDRAADAHHLMETSRHVGKIMLQVAG